MSDEEELEIWELLHQPLRKENAEKFQKMFRKSKELRINKKREDIKVPQITSKNLQFL